MGEKLAGQLYPTSSSQWHWVQKENANKWCPQSSILQPVLFNIFVDYIGSGISWTGNSDGELSRLREFEIRQRRHYCPFISGLGRNKQGWGKRIYPQENQTQQLTWNSFLAWFRGRPVLTGPSAEAKFAQIPPLPSGKEEILGAWCIFWSERVKTHPALHKLAQL